jgi:hypothetical protein
VSKKPNEPKSKIEDLPEKTAELSAEELDHVAGGVVRSPGATKLPVGRVSLNANATSLLTFSSDGATQDVAPDA